MKKIKLLFLFSFLCGGMSFLLFFSGEAIMAAREALMLCVNVIVPSLFPYFVLSYIINGTELSCIFAEVIGPLMRPVFRVSGKCGIALFMGLLSGYPMGAKTAVNLYENREITRREAEIMMAFCNNAGPAFVMGSVGIGVFKSARVGVILFIAQVFSSVLIGVGFGRFWRGKDEYTQKSAKKKRRTPLSEVFISGVKDSFVNVFYICAFIVFFGVFIKMLEVFNVTGFGARFAGIIVPFINNGDIEHLISGVFEVSNGVFAFEGSTVTPGSIALTGAILGWAGVCVHCQVMLFLSKSGVNGKPYIIGKAIQSILCAGFCYVLGCIFIGEVSVFNGGGYYEGYFISFFDSFVFSLAVVIILLFLTFLTVVVKKSFKYRKK